MRPDGVREQAPRQPPLVRKRDDRGAGYRIRLGKSCRREAIAADRIIGNRTRKQGVAHRCGRGGGTVNERIEGFGRGGWVRHFTVSERRQKCRTFRSELPGETAFTRLYRIHGQKSHGPPHFISFFPQRLTVRIETTRRVGRSGPDQVLSAVREISPILLRPHVPHPF